MLVIVITGCSGVLDKSNLRWQGFEVCSVFKSPLTLCICDLLVFLLVDSLLHIIFGQLCPSMNYTWAHIQLALSERATICACFHWLFNILNGGLLWKYHILHGCMAKQALEFWSGLGKNLRYGFQRRGG
jgi:hypothetical protein